MPLDRRVTVRTTVSGVNSFGETVETTTDYPTWATLLQDKLARQLDVGGAYASANRVWRVRYDRRFLDALASEGRVIVIYDDPDATEPPGEGDTITTIGEPENLGRRRFLDLLS